MSIYLTDQTFRVVWQFDNETSEELSDEIEWTEHPVEAQADVANYGAAKPKQVKVSGEITATPLGQPYSRQRVGDGYDALVRIAEAKQPVYVCLDYFAPLVVITKLSGKRENGHRLVVDAEFKTISRPNWKVTQIPKAKMKPKPARRASPPSKGGKTTGSTPSPDRSLAKRLKNLLGR